MAWRWEAHKITRIPPPLTFYSFFLFCLLHMGYQVHLFSLVVVTVPPLGGSFAACHPPNRNGEGLPLWNMLHILLTDCCAG